MGVKDALLLNTTGSNFEALQTNDTARIQGDFSIKKTSDVEVFSVDVSKSTVTVSGNITSSANISSSLTGSFGRIVAQTYHGDGFAIRDDLPRSTGLITSSAQIASQISGAFERGFEASASISGSRTVTGSFGRLVGNIFRGDGSGIRNSLTRTAGIVTSSAQLATAISGSFNKGFEFEGHISGSLNSTASFGKVTSTVLFGDGTNITSSLPFTTGIVSGSAQLATSISGSFNKGFEYTGIIKGSTVTAGGTWSAGGALASSISYHGAAGNKCGQIVAMGVSGNNSLGSLDATRTFEYNGSSWSEAGDNNTNRARAAGAGTVNSGLFFGGYAPNWYGTSQGATETYNGTNFSEVNNMIMPRRAHMGAGLSSEAALALGGYTDSAPVNPGFNPNMGKFTEVWNGTNWSESGDAPANMKRGGMVGSVNAAVMFGSNTDPDLTLHWDGSSWSEGGSGHAPNGIDATHGGTQNDAIRGTTGYVSPNVYTPATQYYNGSTWSEGPNMINAYAHRGMGHNQGSAANSLAAGGEGGPVAGFGGQTATEEHTGGSAIVSSSFGRIVADTFSGTGAGLKNILSRVSGLVTSSAQLATSISGSFNKGFEFVNEISGSDFTAPNVTATTLLGDGSGIIDAIAPGLVSGSAQLATSISGSFKKGFEFAGVIQTAAGGTWSAGGNLTRTTYLQAGGLSGTGTKSAALFIGGRGNKQTEEYDGTSFTERNDLSEVKNQAKMTGTTEAAIVFGGSTTHAVEGKVTNTEEYNGTNWSEVNNMTNARWTHGKLGITSEAALAVAGQFSGYPAATDSVEDWNGTNWSEGTDMPVTINSVTSAGTYDSGIAFGFPTETYCWNGSSWSDVATRAISRYNRAGGAGTSNDAFVAGGQTPAGPYTDSVELFDGTTWSTGPALPEARNDMGSADSSNTGTGAAMIAGGSGPSSPHYCATSREYSSNISSASFGRLDSDDIRGDGSNLTNITLPSGTVSSSAQLATSISGSFTSGFEFIGQISGSSTSTASFGRVEADRYVGSALGFRENLTVASGLISSSKQIASNISGSFNKGFEFDGTISAAGGVFSTGANLGRTVRFLSGLGSVNAAHAIGGNAINTPQVLSEEYDGSSWSEGGELPAANTGGGTSGTVTAGLYFGGAPQGDETFTYNGSNFSETTDLPGSSGANTVGAGSTQDSALAMIGTSANQLNDAYEWNGSNWSEIAAIGTNRGRNQGGGESSEAALVVGGDDTPTCVKTNQTEIWNGSNWSDVASTSHARRYGSFAGTTNDGIVMGALSTPGAQAELWDGTAWSETSALISTGGAHGSAASGRVGVGTLAGGAHKFGGGVFSTPASELFVPNVSTASFGRIDSLFIKGDVTQLTASIISATAFLTGSSQIASRISGSFNKGFELFGTTSGSGGRNSYFVGVSGSAFSHAGNATTMSISSICGSDFDYRLLDTVNQIKGTSYGTGVWSNATAMPAGARARAMAGTQNAFLSAGSYATNNTTTQKFNGSSWSVSANLNNTGRTATGVGTQNAMGVFGGMNPGYTADDKSELYNGATWSNGNNMGTTRSSAGSAGTQNAGIIYGGIVNSPAIKRTETELYDGNAFTETADLSTGRGFASAGGTQNDAIIAAGLGTSNSYGVCTEIWNGTSWTEVANLNTNRWNTTGIGTANHMVVVTGHAGSTGCSHVEEWNGDSWSEVSEMTTLRAFAGPAAGGLGSQGIYAGGYTYPAQVDEVGTTELWNATTTTTGSFGLLNPRNGNIKTEAFKLTSSLFQLPVFNDNKTHYVNNEGMQSTGSLSGSVDRVADVIVGQTLGEMWFDGDKNAIGYTFNSRSVTSQSLNYGPVTQYSSSQANATTSSIGYYTQSFFQDTVVTCYLTASLL